MPDGFSLPQWVIEGLDIITPPFVPSIGTVASTVEDVTDALGITNSDPSCPGCGGLPPGGPLAITAFGPGATSPATAAGGLVDVNVDTSPLLVLGLAWLAFTFLKGK